MCWHCLVIYNKVFFQSHYLKNNDQYDKPKLNKCPNIHKKSEGWDNGPSYVEK